ncbi:MAG: tRNA pseudouridine synthase A [Planctomycetota bacterium]|nr:MAG: tRNA pseudouridine synthase A [Planctomycetota bacterium]
MARYLLLLAYDGGDFAGWWRQPGRRSVAGEILAACQRLGEQPADCVGAARTDAGVHAWAQVAAIDLSRDWDGGTLAHQLSGQLPPDVVCRAALRVADDFPLLGRIQGKTYRYRFDIGATRNPFLARSSWRPPLAPLPDLTALRSAAQACLGRRDWRGLARRGDHREDYHCSIQRVEWTDAMPERWVEITGDRFTYRLVRSLVAVWWAVARGDVSAEDFSGLLAGKDTACAAHQAPARGLCLQAVAVDGAPAWEWPQGA